jgi:hypothetical protein
VEGDAEDPEQDCVGEYKDSPDLAEAEGDEGSGGGVLHRRGKGDMSQAEEGKMTTFDL